MLTRNSQLASFVSSVGLALCIGCESLAADTKADAGKALTPQTAAQIDLTGYWVSVVTEDWIFRAVTPEPGDPGSIPINRMGLQTLQAWDPEKDLSSEEQCKAYGAAAIMRRPGRLRIAWQDSRTLRIDFDAGLQTRTLHFVDALPPSGFPTADPPSEFTRSDGPSFAATRQGYSMAAWTKVQQRTGFENIGLDGATPPPAHQGGSLIVVTTRMLPGYLQENGVAYSDRAVLTEYFDRLTLPNAEEWLVVTSILEDPAYLREPYIASTHYQRESDGSKWDPISCDTTSAVTQSPSAENP